MFFTLIVITNFGMFTMRRKKCFAAYEPLVKRSPLFMILFTFYFFPIIAEQETVILW